jgi:hypothetical protein
VGTGKTGWAKGWLVEGFAANRKPVAFMVRHEPIVVRDRAGRGMPLGQHPRVTPFMIKLRQDQPPGFLRAPRVHLRVGLFCRRRAGPVRVEQSEPAFLRPSVVAERLRTRRRWIFSGTAANSSAMRLRQNRSPGQHPRKQDAAPPDSTSAMHGPVDICLMITPAGSGDRPVAGGSWPGRGFHLKPAEPTVPSAHGSFAWISCPGQRRQAACA